jgi:hypothetical protein
MAGRAVGVTRRNSICSAVIRMDRDLPIGSKPKFRRKTMRRSEGMQEELQRLRVALRVLAAATEFREPAESDLQELRSYASGVERRPDELACEVIQQVLKQRGRVSEGMAEKL